MTTIRDESVRDQIDLIRKRITHVESMFVETQKQLNRLVDHISVESQRLAEALERLDDHLTEHIKHCPTKEEKTP